MATKVGRGGYRPGAGRPKGAKNKPIVPVVLAKSNKSNVENILPSDKIIDIINICKSSNIKNLKYGTLEIEFLSNAAPQADQNQRPAAAPEPVKRIFQDLDDDEAEDLHMSQLLIDDPAAFEQAIIDSHTGRFNAEVEN